MLVSQNKKERAEFKLVLHEILGQFLAVKSPVRDEILRAYASQKYSMFKQKYFIATSSVSRFRVTTNKHLINRVIITFETYLEEKDDNVVDIHDYNLERKVEKECRRLVKPSHPRLAQRSSNDLSNTNFVSRVIEILFQNYRLVISRNRYTIQYKKLIKTEQFFAPDILTLETLYTSAEGPEYVNPIFLSVDKARSQLIGVASFFECMNLSVKTVYYQNDTVVLYQRVCVDKYTKPQHFVLEKEEEDSSSSWRIFFELSFSLEANKSSLSREKNHKTGVPIHSLNNYEGVPVAFKLPKLDGIPALLKFYPQHFVLTTDLVSISFCHTLRPRTVHVLKDYSFLVESNLYVSQLPSASRGLPKPNPMTIIDLKFVVFDAEKRMGIIQELRKKFKDELYPYYIFFQGEPVSLSMTTSTPHPPVLTSLVHNKIYEVQLSSEITVEALLKVSRVIRRRDDKKKPNSRKLVKTVHALL